MEKEYGGEIRKVKKKLKHRKTLKKLLRKNMIKTQLGKYFSLKIKKNSMEQKKIRNFAKLC